MRFFRHFKKLRADQGLQGHLGEAHVAFACGQHSFDGASPLCCHENDCAEGTLSAVAAATAFRLSFILQPRNSQNEKGGSCCYRTPRFFAPAGLVNPWASNQK
jgi:hypothetical protein